MLETKNWLRIDWGTKFNLDFNKADSIRDFYQTLMNNPQAFGEYNAAVYGLDWWSTILEQFMFPAYSWFGKNYGASY